MPVEAEVKIWPVQLKVQVWTKEEIDEATAIRIAQKALEQKYGVKPALISCNCFADPVEARPGKAEWLAICDVRLTPEDSVKLTETVKGSFEVEPPGGTA